MSGLVDSVLSNLGPGQIGAIAAQLGVDPAQAQSAIEHAVPAIVGGMARNASTADGASALNDALGAHGGDLSGILGSVLGGGSGSGIGGAILGHVFGGNQGAVNQSLGQATGMNSQNAGQLMAILAPIVMGALANHAQGQNVGAGGLGGMLAQEVQQVQQQGGSAGGLLNSVLGAGGGNLSGMLGGLLNAFTKR
ncbi:MAG: DUF937 domain-containing protein [Proteobacteria bacterium]|nr:DUF937 domain-containing protein [Pseudomonadota bacterium]